MEEVVREKKKKKRQLPHPVSADFALRLLSFPLVSHSAIGYTFRSGGG